MHSDKYYRCKTKIPFCDGKSKHSHFATLEIV